MFLTYLLQPISLVIFILSFLIVIFPISVIALPFNRSRRLHMTEKFWAIFGRIIIYIACLCKLYKDDRRDSESKSKSIPEGLYIANHSSFMDIPLLLMFFRVPPIMKKEVLYIPIFGLCGYASGAIVVDRKNHDSRRKVFLIAKKRLLSDDKCLQYYPEGTRQRNSDNPKEYSEIKKPLLKIAFETKIPVYSVSIFGTRHILSKKGLVNFRKQIGIILHPKTQPQDFENVDDFMQVCWKKVQDGHKELTEKLT